MTPTRGRLRNFLPPLVQVVSAPTLVAKFVGFIIPYGAGPPGQHATVPLRPLTSTGAYVDVALVRKDYCSSGRTTLSDRLLSQLDVEDYSDGNQRTAKAHI